LFVISSRWIVLSVASDRLLQILHFSSQKSFFSGCLIYLKTKKKSVGRLGIFSVGDLVAMLPESHSGAVGRNYWMFLFFHNKIFRKFAKPKNIE